MTLLRANLLAASALLACASAPRSSSRATREDVTVQRGDADLLRARIYAPNARLRVGSGACEYVHLAAMYAEEGIRPVVSYQVREGQEGVLDAQERASADPTKKHYGQWSLCIDETVPTSLDVTSAGGTFDLSKLHVEALKLDSGDGHVELDLVDVVHPIVVEVSGRSGTIGIRLPERAGLRVLALQAGKTQFDGLRQIDDGSYVNEAWGQPDVPRIELEVVGSEMAVFSRKRNWRGKWR